MNVLVAVVLGVALSIGLQWGLRPTFASDVLARENHRGRRLPTASGLVLIVAVIAGEGVRSVVGLAGVDVEGEAAVVVLAAVVGFGFLGLADDLLGDAHDRGLKGHVRAVTEGRVTTGFVKLAAGAALALVLARSVVGEPAGRVLVDGAVIALAANMGNLFDRAPGRTLKVGLVAAVPLLVVLGTSGAAPALALVLGAAIGLLPADLRERSMMGDTGANALGAALGAVTVVTVAPSTRTVVAAVLLALTLASEVVSFSRIIDAVPPLRYLDRAGRPPVGTS